MITLSEGKQMFSEAVKNEVLELAKREKPDFVVIGPEEPLAAGVVDLLEGELHIPCVGPRQKLARLESSKAFTRELISEYKIPGNPEYQIFEKLDGIERYLKHLGDFVIKPDGLTGGKGVKVSGDHLRSLPEACQSLNAMLRQDLQALMQPSVPTVKPTNG